MCDPHFYGSWDKSKNPYPLRNLMIPNEQTAGAQVPWYCRPSRSWGSGSWYGILLYSGSCWDSCCIILYWSMSDSDIAKNCTFWIKPIIQLHESTIEHMQVLINRNWSISLPLLKWAPMLEGHLGQDCNSPRIDRSVGTCDIITWFIQILSQHFKLQRP